MKIMNYGIKDIKEDMLDGFVRKQESTRIMKYEGNHVIIEDFYYFNEWNHKKLNKKVIEFRKIVECGGNLIVAYDEIKDKVAGFSTLEAKFIDDERKIIEMQYLHVSSEYRAKGLGKRLFSETRLLARKRGAEKIIIGTIPAIETQNFYEKMGCQILYDLNDVLKKREPDEIQRITDVYPNVILASKSPRRKELLGRIFNRFDIMTGVEHDIEKCKPTEYVMKLAKGKAESVVEKLKEKNCVDTLVIGSDTVVVVDNEILGKPKDENQAEKMLNKLSARIHCVYTGVSFIYINGDGNEIKWSRSFYEKTEVKFSNIDKNEIKDYICQENVMDKAGAYSIQGIAGKFIECISGDYYNVMGLPLSKVYKELKSELFQTTVSRNHD